MATSLKTGVNTTTDNGTKKYLDFAGLNALWDNICDKFAPQWKSVNFDFIANSEPTHETSTVVIPFQNLSMPPTAQGVVDHTHVNQTTYTIQAATQSSAGVMSSADKQKLDNLEGTAESAVTLKGVMVGGKTLHLPNDATNTDQITDWKDCLTIDSNKHVAWTLEYNDVKDELQIIDLNAAEANKVKSAVKVSEMLGVVLENALIEKVELTSVNDKNESGTFIAITFKTDARDIVDENGTVTDSGVSTTTIYCNVADLIETYTEGDGISISQNATSIDGGATATTISVIAPKRVSTDNKIGGIIPNKIYNGAVTNWKNTSGTTAPAVQDLGTQSERYFGIETDKDGRAFVNVPSAEAAIGTSTNGADTINNTDANDTFTAVTDVEFTLSEDGKTYTVVPKKTVFTVSKETKLSEDTGSATVSKTDIILNGSTAQEFKVISDIEVNDHKVKLNSVTHTIKETEVSVEDGSVDGEFTNNIDINLIPGETTAIKAPVITNVKKGTTHHAVERTGKTLSFTVADPASIEISYIEGLQWVVPITKQHFPNETVE